MRLIKYRHNIKNQESDSIVIQKLLETHNRQTGEVKKGIKESEVTVEKLKQ
jgi:hypothetical protein